MQSAFAPASGAGYRLLGTALLATGDPVAAEGALRKALALGDRPDDALAALALALIHQASRIDSPASSGHKNLRILPPTPRSRRAWAKPG